VEEYTDEPLIHAAHQICRWHHERWDGKGYPDGLKGEEIPLPAQVVALADVYDALTSERVYKPAFSHDTAVQMILDGKCGAFNPLLLQCLKENEAALRADLQVCAVKNFHQREINKIAAEVLEKAMASAETAAVK
ncbi:MAG: HD domain-containing protein, partial [Elusimicrobiaceae bacterium]|nr:HD domain-containing protein [Elusimicrobiaceae bacterium]